MKWKTTAEKAPEAGTTVRTGTNSMRIIVDQASTATPELMGWAQQQNIQVKSVEEYMPSFEDVFVELVQAVSIWQNWRTSARPISELAESPGILAKRVRWRSRAASTLSRTLADGSPTRESLSFS